ncbi:MAG: hypothetical protein IPI49_20890 [Myxococcales bacterium]|nr:hypothetical protein [Myxococcales bacterium]
MTTDLTPLAEDLLISPHFSPRMEGETTVSILGAQRVDVELDDISRAMLELTTSGLTKESPPSGEIREPRFRATSAGLKARELILHRRCIRHRCLRDQQKYPLKDLIVALVMFPIIANRRDVGGFLGTLPEVWERELEIHLLLYEAGTVVRAAEEVVVLGWMTERTLPEGRLFSITPLGEREYSKRIRGELNLGAGETILDEVRPQVIGVFYAWQSDHNPSRTHIMDALQRIEKIANSSWRIDAQFAIEMATDVGDGAVRIDTALMEKIARADCVVADATPVAVHNGRLLPNPNIPDRDWVRACVEAAPSGDSRRARTSYERASDSGARGAIAVRHRSCAPLEV